MAASIDKGHSPCAPFIHLKGNHYSIGKTVGSTFKSVIHTTLKEHQGLHMQLLPFYETAKGKEAYDHLLATSEEQFPQYMQEIRGIAEGSKADFIQLFLLHIEWELLMLMRDNDELNSNETTPKKGCSDFFVKNEDWILHVHSEDVDPGMLHRGLIWLADIEASEINNYQTESFVAYAYPGMIPGFAWGFNSHGLVISGNVIVQKRTISPGMIPRSILVRALLKEKSIDDFVKALSKLPGSGSGFNFQLSQRAHVYSSKTPDCVRMTGVEVCGQVKENTINVRDTASFDYHFNEYLYLSEECLRGPSSKAREERLEEIRRDLGGYPSNLDQMKRVMADSTNTRYPFYRTGNPPDTAATTNIIIADMKMEELSVYKGKPKEDQADVVLNIQPWDGRPLSPTERIIRNTITEQTDAGL